MQRLLILITGLFLFTAINSTGQELVYEFVPDTTYYESTNFPNTFPEPEDLLHRTAVNFYFAQKRKNSETYDIFARTGKIGNVNISNAIWNQYTGGQYPCLTQKFFDNDDGWEVLFSSANAGVLLLDDDGSTLYISGANNDSTRYSAYIGFDGSSTYLIVENKSGLFSFFLINYSVFEPTSPAPHFPIHFPKNPQDLNP
jgi:hypothetical protein